MGPILLIQTGILLSTEKPILETGTRYVYLKAIDFTEQRENSRFKQLHAAIVKTLFHLPTQVEVLATSEKTQFGWMISASSTLFLHCSRVFIFYRSTPNFIWCDSSWKWDLREAPGKPRATKGFSLAVHGILVGLSRRNSPVEVFSSLPFFVLGVKVMGRRKTLGWAQILTRQNFHPMSELMKDRDFFYLWC